MRLPLTLQTRNRDGVDLEVDVEIVAGVETTLADLSDRFSTVLGTPASTFVSGSGRPLPADALIGGPHLRAGCIVAVGGNGRQRRPTPSVLQLRVVGGPDSGHAVALDRGTITIGRADSADLTIKDPDVSRLHLELEVDHRGLRLTDLSSTNGTHFVGGVQVDGSRALAPGECIQIGSSTLAVVSAGEPPAATRSAPDGTVLVNRPPRMLQPRGVSVIDFPDYPSSSARPRVQLLAALFPAVLAGGVAVMMHNPQFLAFALLGPVTLIATTAAGRRSWRRSGRSSSQVFHDAERGAERDLAARLAEEIERRRYDFPDPAAVASAVSLPDCRIWERKLEDDDFLSVRLGLADQPAAVFGQRSGKPLSAAVAPAVPATASLRGGALGLVGPQGVVRGSARWIAAQLFALHSPRELTLCAFLSHQQQDWRWLRWLWSASAGVRDIATDTAGHQRLLADLLARITDRENGRPADRGGWEGPWTVVLIDRARDFGSMPGLRTLLEDGPAVGITALCIDDSSRLLPPSCRAVAEFGGETGTQLELAVLDQERITHIAADCVSLAWADRLARTLAPLRDAGADVSTTLPPEVRLVNLLGGSLSAPSLIESWQSGPRTATPVGMSGAGPTMLDLLQDGPHALVAGSTGAGKSELLRSWVAGLAVGNAPYDMSFVLIDYKGGAAFAECSGLPHVLGLVTDLDPYLTRRALTSLEAELRRREEAFAAVGAADVTEYRSKAGVLQAQMPRLVLVVDEFASLADDLPSFVSGLIGIAQRGRSLGVHLILATQRPGGVVSPEIKANMALRIALRVIDPGESTDVIGTAAAARIAKSLPGRAFARLASGLVEFQTARIGLRSADGEVAAVRPLDSWNRPIGTGEAGLESADNELETLCRAAKEAVSQLAAPLPSTPWLPPLPWLINAADVSSTKACRTRIAFGVMDDPAHQTQPALHHDLAVGGSLGLIGGPRSGRTTVLRTFIGLAADALDPDSMHCYVIDCASGSLAPLIELPHCGSVATADSAASIARLIYRLSEELDARQRRLAQLGVGSVAEANELGEGLPWIVLALDGWEGFNALSEDYDSGRSSDALLRILRDSAATGFTVLVAGDRATLGVRIASTLRRKFLLGLTDESDYAMAGIPSAAVPAVFKPGRGISADDCLEVQFVLLAENPSAQSQWAAIRRVAARAQAPRLTEPMVIRPLPTRVSPSTRSQSGPLSTARRAGAVLLGVGGDDPAPISIDLFSRDNRFLIVGPARSGRSVALHALAAQADISGTACLVVAEQQSVLARWAAHHGVQLIDPMVDGDDKTACRIAAEFAGQLLLIDDCESLQGTLLSEAIALVARRRDIAIAATARADQLMVSFRGIAFDMRRNRTGLLLQPTISDGELLGVHVPPSREARVPGRGVLVTHEVRRTNPDGLPIQVIAME
ncbi:FtsK/SpoIIIE domain-containing protein [Jatrophihabitans sp. DSM 45814]